MSVWEVPHGHGGRCAEPELRQPLHGERRPKRPHEVRPLVLLGRQPGEGGLLEHRVEHHQPLDGASHGERLAEAAVGLADGGVQPPVVDVIEPRLPMRGRVRGGNAPLDQAREEIAGVVAVNDPREGAVLPHHADTGVQHHGDQERGLALREALALQSRDALVGGQGGGARLDTAEASA